MDGFLSESHVLNSRKVWLFNSFRQLSRGGLIEFLAGKLHLTALLRFGRLEWRQAPGAVEWGPYERAVGGGGVRAATALCMHEWVAPGSEAANGRSVLTVFS